MRSIWFCSTGPITSLAALGIWMVRSTTSLGDMRSSTCSVPSAAFCATSFFITAI